MHFSELWDTVETVDDAQLKVASFARSTMNHSEAEENPTFEEFRQAQASNSAHQIAAQTARFPNS